MVTIPGNDGQPWQYRDRATSEFGLSEIDSPVNSWQKVLRDIAIFIGLILVTGLLEYLRSKR